MLIVISSENKLNNETHLIHSLFEHGLERFHLRKPNWAEQQVRELLKAIESKYWNRISIHENHHLVEEFALGGIHFKEKDRKVGEHRTVEHPTSNIQTSASFHSLTDLQKNAHNFNYCFLSPVFNSISKEGYNGKVFDVNGIKETVIGLGGITIQNMEQVAELGYSGAAVLGSIWGSENPLESFLQLQEKSKQVFA